MSGNHCTVSDGHSSACVTTRSYRYGAFFFHTLYSSLIIFSCIIPDSSPFPSPSASLQATLSTTGCSISAAPVNHTLAVPLTVLHGHCTTLPGREKEKNSGK